MRRLLLALCLAYASVPALGYSQTPTQRTTPEAGASTLKPLTQEEIEARAKAAAKREADRAEQDRRARMPHQVDAIPEARAIDPTGAGEQRDLPSGAPRAEPIRDVPWATAPTVKEVLAVYPAALAEPASSVFRCKLTPGGKLNGCYAMRSKRANAPIDAAARTLLGKFQTTRAFAELDYGDREIEVRIAFPARTAEGGLPLGTPAFYRRPSMDEFMGELADAPLANDFTQGAAMLSCKPEPQGKLGACAVLEETPAGQGLGATAIRLSRYYWLSAWTEEGLPMVGSTLQMPFRFALQ